MFGHVEKQLDKKSKVDFKIYDVTNWITTNYHTYIASYLKKQRQSDNEIWSDNRIKLEKQFSRKVTHKMC